MKTALNVIASPAGAKQSGFKKQIASSAYGLLAMTVLLTSILVASEEGVMKKVSKSEAEWQKELSAEQYHILRQKGTERAFTGKYYNYKSKGIYKCAACGTELFSSETKFDSGTGWPSFFQPIKPDAVATTEDNSYSMERVEALCPVCGGHLGHVFDDGPQPTGKRYCINSASLKFDESK